MEAVLPSSGSVSGLQLAQYAPDEELCRACWRVVLLEFTCHQRESIAEDIDQAGRIVTDDVQAAAALRTLIVERADDDMPAGTQRMPYLGEVLTPFVA